MHHQSELGEFSLSSDSVIPTFDYRQVPPPYLAHIPEAELEDFTRIGYTMGGMMVFPSDQIDRKQTFNQARGTNRTTIGDLFDLTLVCIRCRYRGERNPLGETLAR